MNRLSRVCVCWVATTIPICNLMAIPVYVPYLLHACGGDANTWSKQWYWLGTKYRHHLLYIYGNELEQADDDAIAGVL